MECALVQGGLPPQGNAEIAHDLPSCCHRRDMVTIRLGVGSEVVVVRPRVQLARRCAQTVHKKKCNQGQPVTTHGAAGCDAVGGVQTTVPSSTRRVAAYMLHTAGIPTRGAAPRVSRLHA